MTDETTQEIPEEHPASAFATGGAEGSSQGMRSIPVPEDPAEAVVALATALAEAQQSETARLDDLQRVAAEFENYRKRAEREREETQLRATQRLVEALLPVLDSFDGAFAHDPQTPGEELLKKGVTGTFHQFMEILEREGLEVIDTTGAAFDPELHEAVSGGIGEDLVVADELRRGYRLRGRVIRPSMVVVAPREASDE